MDLEELERIIKIFETSSLSELEIEDKGTRFKLVKRVRQRMSRESVSPPLKEKETIKRREEKREKKQTFVRSPLVGTFYRASSPEDKPFVEVGDRVLKGQTLCIIEAMKVMNEITSEKEGRIKKILVENGQPVEYDQELFLIEEE
ncbi:acetyl-CoA carboxylase biotin carboxyl carrier protein [Candidatus Aerophobetes bacterium]|uniref:Biotin carboxyl carrier protein of acetyl-CoA carboxylase n=1 Tax=Aerophobetes bacterium TaxID=2030807 RepID=A0A662D608_UNCAE|nr:MAG: acetyl-CoA carboxylase biotin carboxyl carrier protein [Candidatus Aerophobetes bacterium]